MAGEPKPKPPPNSVVASKYYTGEKVWYFGAGKYQEMLPIE